MLMTMMIMVVLLMVMLQNKIREQLGFETGFKNKGCFSRS